MSHFDNPARMGQTLRNIDFLFSGSVLTKSQLDYSIASSDIYKSCCGAPVPELEEKFTKLFKTRALYRDQRRHVCAARITTMMTEMLPYAHSEEDKIYMKSYIER